MTQADRHLTLCLFTLLYLSTLLLVGCGRSQQGGEENTDEDAAGAARSAQDETIEDAIRRGARRAGDATAKAVTDAKEGAEKAAGVASDMAQDAKEGAARAAGAMSEALDEAGQRAAAAARTFEVKTALMADERVDASRINVDSEYGARIVRLRGVVGTAAEKSVAALIAGEKSPDWKVSNELMVTPRPE